MVRSAWLELETFQPTYRPFAVFSRFLLQELMLFDECGNKEVARDGVYGPAARQLQICKAATGIGYPLSYGNFLILQVISYVNGGKRNLGI